MLVVKFVLLLLYFCLFSVPAYADEALHWLSPTIGGNAAVMIVDNGSDWSTKLNLRAEQQKGSKIKGRIYTGTRVEIYQHCGDWCTVGLNFDGGTVLTGDVMKQYLAPLENGFSALCPLAEAKTETKVVSFIDMELADLCPGDRAYVMAACGERYFLLLPDGTQGYAPVEAFETLKEPEEHVRICYGKFKVPSGGLTFVDEYTGEEVEIAGGVELEDCWRIAGDTQWHVTFGAGIQRSPRVRGKILNEKLNENRWIPFEGDVYAYGNSFITCVGNLGGQSILRRVDPNGDVFWAMGNVPEDAVMFENDLYRIECEPEELLSRAAIDNIYAYVSERGVLDERGSSKSVTRELAVRCRIRTALELDPGTGKLLRIHVWLEDTDGTYVTGGDLDPRTGEITRWGCNA